MPATSATPVPARRFSLNPLIAFYQSSIGKKMVVAVTGIILMLFVIGHLLGNLEVYLGPGAVNTYAQFLQHLGPILWAIRIILIIVVGTHIVATIQLAAQNRKAAPLKYKVVAHQRSTVASRTMLISGLIVLCFVIYHLLHFTFQVTHPEYRDLHDSLGRHDVYRMVILGFREPLISLFYVLGLFLLANHLSHGFASVTQTLGINNRKISTLISNGGRTLSWLLFLGYISIPAAVMLGLIK
jgi:succinate dehydrogenase / fumarate reductase, cytochrome b subunit